MNLKNFDHEAVLMKEYMLNQMVYRTLDVLAGGKRKLERHEHLSSNGALGKRLAKLGE